MDDEELMQKVEVILFSTGKKTAVSEIAKLVRFKDEDKLREILAKLKEKYDESDRPIMVTEEGDFWKMTTRERFSPIVRKLIADTELTKSLMETLAVVSWKNPVLQSEVIRIRTNKAYAHLDQLEEMGFITRQKHGRTKLIRLTDKFFKYFELSGEEDIKEVFKGISQPEEKPVELEVYEEKPEEQKEEKPNEEGKLGDLEVFEEKEEKTEEKEEPKPAEEVEKPQEETKEKEPEPVPESEPEHEEQTEEEPKLDLETFEDLEHNVMGEKIKKKKEESSESEEEDTEQ